MKIKLAVLDNDQMKAKLKEVLANRHEAKTNTRIEDYIGMLSDEEMKMIDKALRISLGMGRYRKKRG